MDAFGQVDLVPSRLGPQCPRAQHSTAQCTKIDHQVRACQALPLGTTSNQGRTDAKDPSCLVYGRGSASLSRQRRQAKQPVRTVPRRVTHRLRITRHTSSHPCITSGIWLHHPRASLSTLELQDDLHPELAVAAVRFVRRPSRPPCPRRTRAPTAAKIHPTWHSA